MKGVILIKNLLQGMIVLTTASVFFIFGVNDFLLMERLNANKKNVIACGYNQSKKGYSVYYNVNRNDRFHRSCIEPLIEPGTSKSKGNGEGNGCSHQPSVGALLSGSFKRKQHNTCA